MHHRGDGPPFYQSALSANALIADVLIWRNLDEQEWQARIDAILAALDDDSLLDAYDEDKPYRVPLELDGWVLLGGIVYSNAVSGGGTGYYWINAQGQLGYSYFGRGDERRTSRSGLLASIRPDPTLEVPEMIERLNELVGWPRERLLALARGEITVDNPLKQMLDP